MILKSGHKIRCKEPMRIEGPNAILTLATGTLTSYPLHACGSGGNRALQPARPRRRAHDRGAIGPWNANSDPDSAHVSRSARHDRRRRRGRTSSRHTVEPTPAPTPGIKLQSEKYHDERIDQAFSKIFDEKELLIYTTSRGTQPDHFFVQTTTDSEREVFDALETVAEAYVLINRIHPEISPAAVELKMTQTSGKPAGTFRLTPALAKELASGETRGPRRSTSRT